MVSLCVPEQRTWALRYTRDRFREQNTAQGLTRLLSEGEEELERFIATLRTAGRLIEPTRRQSSVSAPAGQVEAIPFSSPGVSASMQFSERGVKQHSASDGTTLMHEMCHWDCEIVQRWLRSEFGLSPQTLAAFDLHRVDGQLLSVIDDIDLSGELGIESRLLRKRILLAIATRKRRDIGSADRT
eukprot:scaffold15622_cov31-Tisochrysis_lutea.AAC.1